MSYGLARKEKEADMGSFGWLMWSEFGLARSDVGLNCLKNALFSWIAVLRK